MRKFLLTGLLAAFVSTLFAQKLSDVQEKIAKGKYDEAKEKLDKFMSDPKNANNADAYYYKGQINVHYAKLDTTGLSFNPINEAFTAYKKVLELDPKHKLMMIDQNIGLFQLFDIQYNKGIKKYNEKKYDEAFAAFSSAVEVQDYIRSKGFSLAQYTPPALDTQLVNLAGASAYLAQKQDQAIPYWERLMDARIKDNDFKDIYRTVIEYYLDRNNQPKADKYLMSARELYPDDEFWVSVEFGNPGKASTDEANKLRDQLNETTAEAQKKELQTKIDALEEKAALEKFARYDQMTKKYTNNFPLAVDYAIEYFNYTYSNLKKPADYAARQEKTTALLTKAISLNGNSALANYVMGQNVYNQIYDLEDAVRAIKGTAAADVAKKKDLNARISQKYEEMYPYTFKAYELYSAETTLKGSDKVNLRKAIDQLIDYHDRKKQADKVAMYNQKLKTL